MDSSEWGGVAAACRELGCTRRVLYKLVEREIIPPKVVAVKVGGRWVFHLPRLRVLRDAGDLSYEG